MTREQRALTLSIHLLIAAARLRRSEITRDEYDSIAQAKIEVFADAEAAAMRERADKVFAEDIVEQSKRMGTRPRDYQSPGQWMEATRRAAIHALPATGEVGRG